MILPLQAYNFFGLTIEAYVAICKKTVLISPDNTEVSMNAYLCATERVAITICEDETAAIFAIPPFWRDNKWDKPIKITVAINPEDKIDVDKVFYSDEVKLELEKIFPNIQ